MVVHLFSKRYKTTLLIILFTGFLTVLLEGCRKDPEELQITKSKIAGYVQKGPFVSGTQIMISELTSDLGQTGKVFSTEIRDNAGAFEIDDVVLSSQYVSFSAQGFYFDEVAGEVSAAPLNLFALSEIGESSSVNVNLLTHLEKRRVEKFIRQNMSFEAAKNQAQAEILSAFGFDKAGMQKSESLSIHENDEGNAMLLAISIILQGKRTVGALTELLAAISAGLYDEGTIDTLTLRNLRMSTLPLNMEDIRNNLIARYNSMDISATIPDFEQYIEKFLQYTAQEPGVVFGEVTGIGETEATLNAKIFPNSAPTKVTFLYGLSSEDLSFEKTLEQLVEGSGDVPVSVHVDDLEPMVKYYFQIKVENEKGMVLTHVESFTTTGTLTDIDGNKYLIKKIGDTFWMTENLRTTRYANGEEIAKVEDTPLWLELAANGTGAWSWPENNEDYSVYGALYNFNAVSDSRNICPEDWKVASFDDYRALGLLVDPAPLEDTDDYFSSQFGGLSLRSTRTVPMEHPRWSLTNHRGDEFGFAALPGGWRHEWEFEYLGGTGFWWTVKDTEPGWLTMSMNIELHVLDPNIPDVKQEFLLRGLAVRCVKE